MKPGFHNKKYLHLQQKAIQDRIQNFPNGKLYLEIGGQFLHDDHASRVLPGYDIDVKKQIFLEFRTRSDIIFCINYQDIINNRPLSNQKGSYTKTVLAVLADIEKQLTIRPKVAINLCPDDTTPIRNFTDHLQKSSFAVYFRYTIPDYPADTTLILSDQGFGHDDYITTDKDLILVSGIASNSGKMSTCLGQLFLDYQHGLSSGYAKFETFPIWNLPLDHPVNRAYEAATVDIGDYNMIDPYHQEAYDIKAVNYNRDAAAFPILQRLIQFLPPDNYMHQYQSPTDMGLNMAGMAITDDQSVRAAALKEINNRYQYYQENYPQQKAWLKKLQQLALN